MPVLLNARTIAGAIQDVLRADALLAEICSHVEIEPDFMAAAEYGLLVGIYPSRWSAPPGMQRISAGRRLDVQIAFEVWCGAFSMDMRDAGEQRDELAARVVNALIGNRRLGGAVQSATPEGGDYLTTGMGEQSFLSMVEIRLLCDVLAIT